MCQGQRLPSAGDSVLSPLSGPLRRRGLLQQPDPKPYLGLGRSEATNHMPSLPILAAAKLFLSVPLPLLDPAHKSLSCHFSASLSPRDGSAGCVQVAGP